MNATVRFIYCSVFIYGDTLIQGPLDGLVGYPFYTRTDLTNKHSNDIIRVWVITC